MNQCKQCGATLPENTNVCLQCGTKNVVAKHDSEDLPKKELDFLKPALAGGAFLGVLSALPYIRAVNVACCLWVLAGGALAAYLLNNQQPGGLKYGDGAMVGAFAGLMGAIIGTVVGIPVRLLENTPARFAEVEAGMSRLPPNVPSWAKDIILEAARPGFNLTLVLIGLVVGLVLYAVFATAGGAITVAIMNRKKTD